MNQREFCVIRRQVTNLDSTRQMRLKLGDNLEGQSNFQDVIGGWSVARANVGAVIRPKLRQEVARNRCS
jgi:hypothetical protein